MNGKSPLDSRCEMTQLVLPSHTNMLGTIFGGQIMQWVDIAASIAAMRHAGTDVVTASIDALHFFTPVHVGEAVILKAQVNEAFRTSMEVGVRVEAEDPRQPELGRRCTTKAYLTFVALDSDKKPSPIPSLVASDAPNQRRQKQARLRRENRQKVRLAMESGI